MLFQDTPPIRRNEVNEVASPRQLSKENDGKIDDEMPSDATNNKDDADVEDEERDNETRDEFERTSENIQSFAKEEDKNSKENDHENDQHSKQTEMVSRYSVLPEVEAVVYTKQFTLE